MKKNRIYKTIMIDKRPREENVIRQRVKFMPGRLGVDSMLIVRLEDISLNGY